MRDTVHTRISLADQLASAELCQLLPVLLKHVERVSVFKVLKRHEAIVEPCAKVSRELPGAHDVSGGLEPIEHP